MTNMRYADLVLALATAAAAENPAHDDEEGGQTGEEEDRDEEALHTEWEHGGDHGKGNHAGYKEWIWDK